MLFGGVPTKDVPYILQIFQKKTLNGCTISIKSFAIDMDIRRGYFPGKFMEFYE